MAIFQIIVWSWIALALILFTVQLYITAPYGRHLRRGWGPMIDNRLGWIAMEVVSPLIFGYLFLSGDNAKTAPMWIFFGLWMAHYLHRSLIYPFRTRTKGKRMPLSIVLSAAFFNLINASLNGYWLGTLGPVYDPGWLTDPRMITGFVLFLGGAAVNLWADTRLIHLRQSSGDGYRIPRGGLFRYISCPNHLGEIVEWSGFALMCWNLPAFSFAIWTAANLLPRARAHHRWYREHFEDYPDERWAVIPGVW